MTKLSDDIRDLPSHFYLVAIIACWDAFTTIIGTIKALGGVSFGSMFLGVMSSVIVVIVIFMTFEIWSDTSRVFRDNKLIQSAMRGMWGLAVVYDVYTSVVGNATLMSVDFGSMNGVLVLVMATLLVTGSSFVAAYIMDEHRNSKPRKSDY
jgi:hypothetical protein